MMIMRKFDVSIKRECFEESYPGVTVSNVLYPHDVEIFVFIKVNFLFLYNFRSHNPPRCSQLFRNLWWSCGNLTLLLKMFFVWLFCFVLWAGGGGILPVILSIWTVSNVFYGHDVDIFVNQSNFLYLCVHFQITYPIQVFSWNHHNKIFLYKFGLQLLEQKLMKFLIWWSLPLETKQRLNEPTALWFQS